MGIGKDRQPFVDLDLADLGRLCRVVPDAGMGQLDRRWLAGAGKPGQAVRPWPARIFAYCALRARIARKGIRRPSRHDERNCIRVALRLAELALSPVGAQAPQAKAGSQHRGALRLHVDSAATGEMIGKEAIQTRVESLGRAKQAQRQGTRGTPATQRSAEGSDQRLGGRSRRRQSTERRPGHPKADPRSAR